MVDEELFDGKILTGYLIVNYKSGLMRIMKKKPTKSKLSPAEIPIRLELTINIPKLKEMVAKGEITVSETKVREMMIEEI